MSQQSSSSILRYTFGCIVMLIATWSSIPSTQAYVTDRFDCDVTWNSVTVALTTDDSQFDSCFMVLKALEDEIMLIEENIDRAQEYIQQWRQPVFWTETIERLQDQRGVFRRSQNQLIDAISDFERELFIRIKTISYLTLNQERIEIRENLRKMQRLLTQFERQWDVEQYALIRGVLSALKTQEFYLQTIQQSTDFATLLPALKVYFSVQWPLI